MCGTPYGIAALTPEEYVSSLARRPYDLRYAAVSPLLDAGVPPTQVAEWAGHSVAVLLRVYAKCIAGPQEQAKDRVALALGLTPTEQPPTMQVPSRRPRRLLGTSAPIRRRRS